MLALTFIFQLEDFLLHEYQELLKTLSTLHLIKSRETDNIFLDNISLIENKVYDALCGINIVLQNLGVTGVDQVVQIERTTDMCDVTNTLERYVRDLELFKLLERVFQSMHTRLARKRLLLS